VSERFCVTNPEYKNAALASKLSSSEGHSIARVRFVDGQRTLGGARLSAPTCAEVVAAAALAVALAVDSSAERLAARTGSGLAPACSVLRALREAR
jgi:hypothetical protein